MEAQTDKGLNFQESFLKLIAPKKSAYFRFVARNHLRGRISGIRRALYLKPPVFLSCLRPLTTCATHVYAHRSFGTCLAAPRGETCPSPLFAVTDTSGFVYVYDANSGANPWLLNDYMGPKRLLEWGEVVRETKAPLVIRRTLPVFGASHSRSPATAVGFFPSKLEFIASGSIDKSISIWDITKSSPVMTGNMPGSVRAIAINSRGIIYAALGSEVVAAVDVRQPISKHGILCAPIDEAGRHRGDIFSLSFFPGDERHILTGGKDRSVRLWDVRHPTTLLRKLKVADRWPARWPDIHRTAVRAIAASPCERLFVTRGRAFEDTRVWDAATLCNVPMIFDSEDGGRNAFIPAAPPPVSLATTQIDFVPTELNGGRGCPSMLSLGGDSGKVCFVELVSGRLCKELTEHLMPPASLGAGGPAYPSRSIAYNTRVMWLRNNLQYGLSMVVMTNDGEAQVYGCSQHNQLDAEEYRFQYT